MQTRRWIPKKSLEVVTAEERSGILVLPFLPEESMLSSPLKSRPLLENNLDEENGYHGQSTLHIPWH